MLKDDVWLREKGWYRKIRKLWQNSLPVVDKLRSGKFKPVNPADRICKTNTGEIASLGI
jgi:hypothetical protein